MPHPKHNTTALLSPELGTIDPLRQLYQVVEKPFWHRGNIPLLGDQGQHQNSSQDGQKGRPARPQQARRRRPYSVRNAESPSAARTKLADPSAMLRADFFNILLCSNLFMGFWREPRVTRPEVQDHCSKPSGLLT